MSLQEIGIIIGITFMYATPLIYAAIGGVMSENTGVVNIGLEGIMSIGALIAATVAHFSGSPWLAFLCGGLAGLIIAIPHALATIKFGADHVVSGTAINFLGPGLALFLCRIFFDGGATSKPLTMDQKLPQLFQHTFAEGSFLKSVFNQYATFYIALILVALVYIILYNTKLGLRMRAVGEHPLAADTLGINVRKIKYFGVLSSGFLAGLGGASLSIAVVANFRTTLVSGQGFIALAAMIFGNWKPQGALMASLLFGLAQGLAIHFGGGNTQIPSSVLSMLPYVLTLIILVITSGKSRSPKANGLQYVKKN